MVEQADVRLQNINYYQLARGTIDHGHRFKRNVWTPLSHQRLPRALMAKHSLIRKSC